MNSSFVSRGNHYEVAIVVYICFATNNIDDLKTNGRERIYLHISNSYSHSLERGTIIAFNIFYAQKCVKFSPLVYITFIWKAGSS